MISIGKTDKILYQRKLSLPKDRTDNPDTGRFQNKYNPDKKGKTSRFRNQGYDGSMYSEFDLSKEAQSKRLDEREKSYHKWQSADHKVTKKQLNAEPRDQIGSVSSSWLTSLGYNTATSEAVATFKGSSAEFYYKMAYETFLEWLNSPSKGRWLHDHPGIMGRYSQRGGGAGGRSMQSRIDRFYRTDKTRTRINNTSRYVERSKSRRDKYLEKYR